MADAQLKSKFENVSKGVAGAVVFGLDGKPQGVPVPYKGVIWLSEEEEILTANAPRNEADNPFANGTFRLLVRGAEVAHARPIGSTQGEPEPEPTAPEDPPAEPPAPADEGDKAVGDDASGEIKQERPAAPQDPTPPAPSGPGAGAEVVQPSTQARSTMRPSSSPAAAPLPPPKAP